MNISEIAKEALADISSKTKGCVRASRRGIVAASDRGGGHVTVFRRQGGKVHLELWLYGSQKGLCLTEHPLAADLEQRAATMLDEL